MARWSTEIVTSVTQLRRRASAWDDLWRRSEVTSPLARAELIALWHERFTPQAPLAAWLVCDGGEPVAALPVVGRRLKGVAAIGALPGNEWSAAGDLLLDPTADVETALTELVLAIAAGPWPLLWCDEVRSDAAHWRRFVAALNTAGLSSEQRSRYAVGWLPTEGAWSDYEASLPKNHRRNLGRYWRQLADQGNLVLETHEELAPAAVATLVHEGFAVEDRSWKGRGGTSVLRTPGMLAYYQRQAEQLAAWGQLAMYFLRLDGRPLAFDFGYLAKGVYHSAKIGYDEEFARYSPGQLLMGAVAQPMFANTERRGIDFVGPLTESAARWQPATYEISRLVTAQPKTLGSALMFAYRYWRQWKQASSSLGGNSLAPLRLP